MCAVHALVCIFIRFTCGLFETVIARHKADLSCCERARSHGARARGCGCVVPGAGDSEASRAAAVGTMIYQDRGGRVCERGETPCVVVGARTRRLA
jgi:hypothetical protein